MPTPATVIVIVCDVGQLEVLLQRLLGVAGDSALWAVKDGASRLDEVLDAFQAEVVSTGQLVGLQVELQTYRTGQLHP